jgi:hypothetical protein
MAISILPHIESPVLPIHPPYREDATDSEEV